jgi:hypothetical protein
MVRAARNEQRMSDVILAVLMLLGWTMTWVAWGFWRLMTGAPLLEITLGSATLWIGGSTLLAWLTAGAAAVLLATRREAIRR